MKDIFYLFIYILVDIFDLFITSNNQTDLAPNTHSLTKENIDSFPEVCKKPDWINKLYPRQKTPTNYWLYGSRWTSLADTDVEIGEHTDDYEIVPD